MTTRILRQIFEPVDATMPAMVVIGPSLGRGPIARQCSAGASTPAAATRTAIVASGAG
jgi:hypothetical protein